MSSNMDTFTARLASFDTVLKPEKRRSSTTKGAKTVRWPHQRPSPAELAHAGFYYKPYESNPDNTICFQCNRALDGWEEEDEPVTEHLKHSPDCAWAIMMDISQHSSNPAAIEDPTSSRIAQARLDSFGSTWPHDGKRGWLCQSEKMVDSGWFFCPTDDSNDLATCVYCKLSLDGWEPKDDPFDEHYRRSPGCSFFVYAQPPGKKGKGAKAKKPRTSKASSRLSTQSIATTTSEAPEMDVDESMDQSVLSQATAKPKTTRKGKGKGKGTKGRKADMEEESEIDVDTTELEKQPEPAKPKRTGKGNKRVSEEMIAHDEPEPEPESHAEPPAKRRATGTRSSSVSRTYDYESVGMPDAEPAEEAHPGPKKRGRKPKKATAKNRKASDVSVASQPASKARGPRDSELDAALQAELEADAPQPAESDPEPEQPPASKSSKTSKKSKALPKSETHDTVDDSNYDGEDQAEALVDSKDVDMEETDAPAPVGKTTKGSKKKGPKKTKKEENPKESTARQSPDTTSAGDKIERENPESRYQQEPGTQLEDKAAVKKSSKGNEKPKKAQKAKKKEPSPPPKESSPPPESVVEEYDNQLRSGDEEEFGTPDDLPDQVEMVEPPRADSPQERTPIPPKTTKRYSDIPQEEHFAHSFSESQRSSARKEPEATPRPSNRVVSPLPDARQSTPSLSPQSSDAENRPPSSRPSANRPTISSPSKEHKGRTPLAASTPSPSKRNFNGGFAASTHPWTPVDIDAALFGNVDEKENADLSGLFNGVKGGLSSPEKKMSVEEWVMWNAKNGEERLKRECERLVGQFENEGGRAMRRIEAIECID
ncbi:hypothetical protein N7492_007119 [Penicillium capsulatum]|uniref:Chromosome segregation protein BIR1 n=1 Tax=Penicillium capsulatum TaxID=69766 RepID=A0A9W9I218_9EURO|nr:hypothetical protein N7492_007119 [Penicillium capsulatum]KAJ6116956.1 hypothetical protein N7512_006681 [Penicillium capsulatum]